MFRQQYKEGLKLLKHSKPYKMIGRVLFVIMITLIGFVDFAIFSSNKVYGATTTSQTSTSNGTTLSNWYSLNEIDSCRYYVDKDNPLKPLDITQSKDGGGYCYLPNDLNLITNTDKFEYVSDKTSTYKEVSFYRWSDNLEVQEASKYLNTFATGDGNDLSSKTIVYNDEKNKQYTYFFTPTGNEYHYYTLTEMNPNWKNYQLAVDYYTTGSDGETKYYKTIDDAIFETTSGEVAYYDAKYKTILGSETYDQLKLASNFRVSYDLTGNILYDDTTDGYYKIADSKTLSDINTYHQTKPVSSYRKTDSAGLVYSQDGFNSKSYFDTTNNRFYLYNSDRHEFAVYVITDANVNYDEYVTDKNTDLLDGYVFFDNAGTVKFYKTYVMGISSKVLNLSSTTTNYDNENTGKTVEEFNDLSNSSTTSSTTIFDLTDEEVGKVNSYEYVWDYIIANKEKWSATYAKVMYNYVTEHQTSTTKQNYKFTSTTSTTNAINLTNDFSNFYNDPKLNQVYYNIDEYKITGNPAYYTYADNINYYSTTNASTTNISTSADSTISAYYINGNYYDNRNQYNTGSTSIAPSTSTSNVQIGSSLSNYTYDKYYITKSTSSKDTVSDPSDSYPSAQPTASKLSRDGSYTWYSGLSTYDKHIGLTLTSNGSMGYFKEWTYFNDGYYDYGDGDTGTTYRYAPVYTIYVEENEYNDEYDSYSYFTVDVVDTTQSVYYDDYEVGYPQNFTPTSSGGEEITPLSFSDAYGRSNTTYTWYDIQYDSFGGTAPYENNGRRTFRQWIDYMLNVHEPPTEDVCYNYTITTQHYEDKYETYYKYTLNTINWTCSSYTGSHQTTIDDNTNISNYNGSTVYKNERENYSPIYESRTTLTFSNSTQKAIFEAYFKNKGITTSNAYKSSTSTSATVTTDYWRNTLSSVSSSNKITIYYLPKSYGLGSPFYTSSTNRYYTSSFTYYCYYDKYVLNSTAICSDVFASYDDAKDYALDNGYLLSNIQANKISYYKLTSSNAESTKTWTTTSSSSESLDSTRTTGAFNTTQSGDNGVSVSSKNGWNSVVEVTRNYTRDYVKADPNGATTNDMTNTYTSTVIISPSDDVNDTLTTTKGTAGTSDYYARVSDPTLIEYITDERQTLTTNKSYRQSLTDTNDHTNDNLPEGLDYCRGAGDTNCVNLTSMTKTSSTPIYKYTKTITSYSWTQTSKGDVAEGASSSYTTVNDYKKFYTQNLNDMSVKNDGSVNYTLGSEAYSDTVSSMTSINLINPQSLYSLSPEGLVRQIESATNAYYSGTGVVNVNVPTVKNKTYTLSFNSNNVAPITVKVESNPVSLSNNGGRYYYTFTSTDTMTSITFSFANVNNTSLGNVCLRSGNFVEFIDYVEITEKTHSNTYYKRNLAEKYYETALINLYYGSNFTTTGDVLTYFNTTTKSLTSKAKSNTTLTIKGENGTVAANTTYYYSYKLNDEIVSGSLISDNASILTLTVPMSKDDIVSDIRITRAEEELANCDITSDVIVYNDGVKIERAEAGSNMDNIVFEVEIFLEKARNVTFDLATSVVYQQTSDYYTMENLTTKDTITKEELTSYARYYDYYYPISSLEGQFALLTQEGELDVPYNPAFIYKYGDNDLGIRDNNSNYRKVSFYEFVDYVESDATLDDFINLWNTETLDGVSDLVKVIATTGHLTQNNEILNSNWYNAIKDYSKDAYSYEELDKSFTEENHYYLMQKKADKTLPSKTSPFVFNNKKFVLSLVSDNTTKLVEYSISYKTGSYVETKTITNDFKTITLANYGDGHVLEQLDYDKFVANDDGANMYLVGEFKDWFMVEASIVNDSKQTISAPRYTITVEKSKIDVIDFSQTTTMTNKDEFILPDIKALSFEDAYYSDKPSTYNNGGQNGLWIDSYSVPLVKKIKEDGTFVLDITDNYTSAKSETTVTCLSEWIRDMLKHNGLSTYDFPERNYRTEFYKWYLYYDSYDDGGDYGDASWLYSYHPVYKVCADKENSEVIYVMDFSQSCDVVTYDGTVGVPYEWEALKFSDAFSRNENQYAVWQEYDNESGRLIDNELKTFDTLTFADWTRKLLEAKGYSLENYEINEALVFRINGGTAVNIYRYNDKYYIKDEIREYDFSSKGNGDLTVLYKEDGTSFGFNKLYEKDGTNTAVVYDFYNVMNADGTVKKIAHMQALDYFEPLNDSENNVFVLDYEPMPDFALNGNGFTKKDSTTSVPTFLLRTKYNDASMSSLKNAYDLYGINSWSKTYSTNAMTSNGLTNTGEFLSIDEMLGWYYNKYCASSQVDGLKSELYKILCICEKYIENYSLMSRSANGVSASTNQILMYNSFNSNDFDTIYLQFTNKRTLEAFIKLTDTTFPDEETDKGYKVHVLGDYAYGTWTKAQLQDMEVNYEKYGFSEKPFTYYTSEEVDVYSHKNSIVDVNSKLFPYYCMNFGSNTDSVSFSGESFFVKRYMNEYDREYGFPAGSVFSTNEKGVYVYKDGNLKIDNLSGLNALDEYLHRYNLTADSQDGSSILRLANVIESGRDIRYAVSKDDVAYTDIESGRIFDNGSGGGWLLTTYPTDSWTDERTFRNYLLKEMLRTFYTDTYNNLPNNPDYNEYTADIDKILNKFNLSTAYFLTTEEAYNSAYVDFYKNADGSSKIVNTSFLFNSSTVRPTLDFSGMPGTNKFRKTCTETNTIDFNAFYSTALSTYLSLCNDKENSYNDTIMNDIDRWKNKYDYRAIDVLIQNHFGEENVAKYLEVLFPSITVTPYEFTSYSFTCTNDRASWDIIGHMFAGDSYRIFTVPYDATSSVPIKYFYTTKNIDSFLPRDVKTDVQRQSPYFKDENTRVNFSMPDLFTDKTYFDPTDLLVLEAKDNTSGYVSNNYVYVKMNEKETYPMILNSAGVSYKDLYNMREADSSLKTRAYDDSTVKVSFIDSSENGIVYDTDYTFGSNYQSIFDVKVTSSQFVDDFSYFNYALAYRKSSTDSCIAGYTNATGTNVCYYDDETLSLTYKKDGDNKMWYTAYAETDGSDILKGHLFNEEKVTLPPKYKTTLYVDVVMKNNHKLSFTHEITTSDNLVPNPYYAFSDGNVNLNNVDKKKILGLGENNTLSRNIQVVPKPVFDAIFGKNLTVEQKKAMLEKSVAGSTYVYTDSHNNKFEIPNSYLPKIEYNRDVDVKFKIVLYADSGDTSKTIEDSTINKINLVKNGRTLSSATWNGDGYWFSTRDCGLHDVLKSYDFNPERFRDYLTTNFLFELSSSNDLKSKENYHIGIELCYSNAEVYIDNNQNGIFDNGVHSNYYYDSDQTLTTTDIDMSDVYDVTDVNSEYYSFSKDYAYFVSGANYQRVDLPSGTFLMLLSEDNNPYIAG